MKERKKLPPDFDSNIYLELHADVRAAGVDAAEHYLQYGIHEGRAYKPRNADFLSDFAAFLTEAANDQNSFDIFSQSWSTEFEGVKTGGSAPLANDMRIRWLLDRINVSGKKVLELGPLEAGHTYMLEKSGAKVLAIEANKSAFLRCLIVKNYLGLSSKFLLGDFEKTEFSTGEFDMVLASGVLYHMRDPVSFLKKFAAITNTIFIWTHYFEPDLSKWNKNLQPAIESGKWDVTNTVVTNIDHLNIRTVKQHYKEALGWSGFCGGTGTYSNWIYREDLISLLNHLGFKNTEISFDHVNHQNGPAFCILAQK